MKLFKNNYECKLNNSIIKIDIKYCIKYIYYIVEDMSSDEIADLPDIKYISWGLSDEVKIMVQMINIKITNNGNEYDYHKSTQHAVK